MEKYNIRFKRSAVKELETIPKNDLQKIIKRIQDLSSNPRPAGSQKLSNSGHHRVRQGDYRIIYLIIDAVKTVEIYKVSHRKEVYRS